MPFKCPNNTQLSRAVNWPEDGAYTFEWANLSVSLPDKGGLISDHLGLRQCSWLHLVSLPPTRATSILS